MFYTMSSKPVFTPMEMVPLEIDDKIIEIKAAGCRLLAVGASKLHVLKYKHNTGTFESPISFPMDVTAGCALVILSDLIVGFGQEIKEPNQHGVLRSLSLDKLVSSNMILGSAKQGRILHKKRTSVITETAPENWQRNGCFVYCQMWQV